MFTEDQRKGLARGASAWQLALTENDLDRFERYSTLLEAGNQQLNLTRIRPEDYVTLHFLDSLALAAIEKPSPGHRLIDVGTGAGFPGIPLAIAFPGIQVTLVDSTRKRLRFLDVVIAELGLKNARTLHARSEDLTRDAVHRAGYDYVTARAVAAMPTLSDWLIPLAKCGGLVVAYKSRDATAEIEAARNRIETLGGEIERIADIVLPETDVVRKLVLIRKRREAATRSNRRRTHR